METKKNSLPVVMSFIADFLSVNDQLCDLNAETREIALAELMAKPLDSLSPAKINQLCSRLKEFCTANKETRCFIKFPDLFSFDELARYFALDENICRIPTRERMIQLWVKETGASAKKLLPASVDSKVITRCLAIRICEMAEELTGRTILADCSTPMQYLGTETTFNDIIDFFTLGSKKIDDIRYKIFKTTPVNIQAYLMMFRNEATKAYALNCGKENLSEEALEQFKTNLVFDCKLPDFMGEHDWDLPVWWTEDLLNVQLSAKLDWINPSTKVSEVIDAFVDAKEKQLTN